MNAYILAAAIALISCPSFAADITGKAKADSAGTIFLAKQKLRLFGVNAPGKRQFCPDTNGGVFECGAMGAKYLKDVLKGAEVSCDIVKRGNDDTLAEVQCSADGQDLGLTVIRAGFAQAIPGAVDAYDTAQIDAFKAGEGLWAFNYVDFSVVENPASAKQAGCDIKGNISGTGRVFHDTSSRWYKRTSIEPQFGERWFCSAGEARAAGWRAPG